MTEDEAFIRAIVDGPGDDLPRRVYADWLDDRADPRGPYLRAEREAVETGDTARLRELAAGLDPVWVARVSRPPLGVCCAHLALSSTGRFTEPDELDAASDALMVVVPDQVRALLLNYSLGQLRGGPFVMPTAGGERIAVDAIACLEDPDFQDGWASYELVDRTVWARDEYGLDDAFVFLAATFSEVDFVVSCRPRDRGSVHRMDGEEMLSDPEAGVTRVAASVGEFLSMLLPRSWPLTDELD